MRSWGLTAGLGAGAARVPEASIRKTNFQAYSQAGSSFAAYAGLWYLYIDPTLGLGHTAVEGVDFESNVTVRPATFPNGSVIRWRVPDQPAASAGVYGYLGQPYGNYQWTTVGQAASPRQVYTVTALTTVFDFAYASPRDSSVLEEMWLTSAARPNGTEVDAYRTHEVGAFRRTSAGTVSYMGSKTALGTVNDGTREWTVAIDTDISPPFIMFRPTSGADITGPIEWPVLWAWLIQQGRITGNEYYNGHMAGVEPSRGEGTLTVITQSTSYAGAARVPWTIANLSATTQSSSTVLLTYSAAAGATAHQYRANGGAWTAMPGNRIVTGLSASTAYSFEVRGTNATGNGAASNTATATTNAAGVSNVVVNGDFSDTSGDPPGGWADTNWSRVTLSGGKAVFADLQQYYSTGRAVDVSAWVGKYVELTYTISDFSAGSVRALLTGGTQRTGTTRTANGTFKERFLVASGNNYLQFQVTGGNGSGGNTFKMDDVSLVGPYTTATVGGA